MTRIFSTFALVALTFSFMGQAQAGPGEVLSEDERSVLSEDERSVQLVEAMAVVVGASAGDCDKLGDTLSRFIDENRAQLQRLDARTTTQSLGEKQAFEAKYGQRTQAAARGMMGGIMACMKNPKVLAAMQKMKSEQPNPGGGTGVTEADAEKAVMMMEDMAELATQHQGNCNKMGHALAQVLDGNMGLIQKLDKGQTAAQKKAFDLKYGERVAQAGKRMVQGLVKCPKNPKVMAAMKRMQSTP